MTPILRLHTVKIHLEITARCIGKFVTFMYTIKNETSTVN
jgi:hypothetical protein